jgi:hypothetical protein
MTAMVGGQRRVTWPVLNDRNREVLGEIGQRIDRGRILPGARGQDQRVLSAGEDTSRAAFRPDRTSPEPSGYRHRALTSPVSASGERPVVNGIGTFSRAACPPGMPNHPGDHSDQYRGFPALRK